MRGQDTSLLDVFRLGSEAPLGFKVSSTNAGTVQTGDARPKLSPDGRWLAYGLSGRLWLAPVDGTAPPQKITEFAEGEVDLLLSGWSPDSQTLLFHQGKPMGEEMGEEPPPLPASVKEGFTLLTLTGRRVDHLAQLEGFDTWDSDNQHVFFARSKPDRGTDIVRADLRGGAAAVLQETADPNGFGQLARCGNDLAYLLKSRIERSKPDGASLVHVTPPGAFAEYQWPVCSPDYVYTAWTHRVDATPNGDSAIEVTTAGRPLQTLDRCKGGCAKFGWESPTTILVLDTGEVRRLGLDGSRATVATGVADLVLPDPQ